MKNFVVKVLHSAVICAVGLTGSNVGYAQGDTTVLALEEVVVVARKRTENLQEVPVSITALTGEQLKNQGVFNTSDLNNSMPNLNVSSSYGETQPNFTIRGIGVGTEYNSNAASPNGIYVDDVYQAFRASHGQQLYDLAQIEVLRGPQGTLYGRNTTGGAINFTTMQPQFGETQGYITAGYGNYNRFETTGAIDFTPSENLGIRIAGTYTERDAYIENRLPTGPVQVNPNLPGPSYGYTTDARDAGGGDTFAVRFNAHLDLDRLNVRFKAYISEASGDQDSPQNQGEGGFIAVSRGAFGGLYGIGLDDYLPPAYPGDRVNDLEIEADTIGGAKVESDGVVLNVSYDISDSITLTSITGFDNSYYGLLPNIDCDGTPFYVCAIGYESDMESFNQDLRVNFTSDRLSLIVGLYYGEDEIVTNNRPNFFGFLSDTNAALGAPTTYFNPGGALGLGLPTPFRATQDYTQERESLAIYGEATYDVTDKLSLTVGLRSTQDDFAYVDALTTFFDDAGAARAYFVSDYLPGVANGFYLLDEACSADGTTCVPASTGTAGPLNQSDDSNQTTGRVIVDYKVSDDVMLFASYSKGYRGGTYNGLAFQSAAQVYFVEPEVVDVFEAGFKGRFMNDRIQLNATAFYYDYEGQQQQVIDPNSTTFLINLDGEMMGMEAELTFLASENLQFNLGIGILDSEFKDGNCEGATQTGALPQDGNCIFTAAGIIDVGGNPFPYAAEESANLGMDWDVGLFAGGDVRLHIDAAYSGHYHYDTFGNYSGDAAPLGLGPIKDGSASFWTSNARITWEKDAFAVAVWGKNLTDETYYPNGINVEGSYNSTFLVRAAPLTYGAELRYSF